MWESRGAQFLTEPISKYGEIRCYIRDLDGYSFEGAVDNVRRAAKDFGVNYPIAVDSEHAVWRTFQKEYWPALYFVDALGRLRHHQFGEGGYEESGKVIQQLLADAGAKGIVREPVSVNAAGTEAAADWSDLKSPENYLGYERTEIFVSPSGTVSTSAASTPHPNI